MTFPFGKTRPSPAGLFALTSTCAAGSGRWTVTVFRLGWESGAAGIA